MPDAEKHKQSIKWKVFATNITKTWRATPTVESSGITATSAKAAKTEAAAAALRTVGGMSKTFATSGRALGAKFTNVGAMGDCAGKTKQT